VKKFQKFQNEKANIQHPFYLSEATVAKSPSGGLKFYENFATNGLGYRFKPEDFNDNNDAHFQYVCPQCETAGEGLCGRGFCTSGNICSCYPPTNGSQCQIDPKNNPR